MAKLTLKVCITKSEHTK